jgi:hypothetical protein
MTGSIYDRHEGPKRMSVRIGGQPRVITLRHIGSRELHGEPQVKPDDRLVFGLPKAAELADRRRHLRKTRRKRKMRLRRRRGWH